MGRRYKYCSVCRQEGGLVYCSSCRLAYHRQCSSLLSSGASSVCETSPVPSFLCEMCVSKEAEERQKKENAKQEKEKEKEKEREKETTEKSSRVMTRRRNRKQEDEEVTKEEEDEASSQAKGDAEPDEDAVSPKRKKIKRENNEMQPLSSSPSSAPSWKTVAFARRAAFLSSIKGELRPFCDVGSLNKALSVPIANPHDKKKLGRPPKPKATSYNSFLDDNISIEESLQCVKNVTLRDFQIEGVDELCGWFKRSVGGVFGDDMGLGKKIQTLALIAILKERSGIVGPHLIVAPHDVVQIWANELLRCFPCLSFKRIYSGRSEDMPSSLEMGFDIYLVSSEVLKYEVSLFSACNDWVSLALDEGHRLRHDEELQSCLADINCSFRLILMGLPLQNDAVEMWVILKFIFPDLFHDTSRINEGLSEEETNKMRHLLDKSLILRRQKQDTELSLLPKVYFKIRVPMSDLQGSLYRSVLSGDCLKKTSRVEDKVSNILYLLLKICGHPKLLLNYRNLFHSAKLGTLDFEGLETLKDEKLVSSCGKLMVLDKLLQRFKKQGSRVVVFTQWLECVDMLAEYMTLQHGASSYFRLDVNTSIARREVNTRCFNSKSSEVFAYLVQTCCGHGFSLPAADCVVFYDVSWNPLVDLQAEDRVHRIGQDKQVLVYRLITSACVEEQLADIVELKRIFDHFLLSKPVSKQIIETSTIISSRKGAEKSESAPSRARPSRRCVSSHSDKCTVASLLKEFINRFARPISRGVALELPFLEACKLLSDSDESPSEESIRPASSSDIRLKTALELDDDAVFSHLRALGEDSKTSRPSDAEDVQGVGTVRASTVVKLLQLEKDKNCTRDEMKLSETVGALIDGAESNRKAKNKHANGHIGQSSATDEHRMVTLYAEGVNNSTALSTTLGRGKRRRSARSVSKSEACSKCHVDSFESNGLLHCRDCSLSLCLDCFITSDHLMNQTDVEPCDDSLPGAKSGHYFRCQACNDALPAEVVVKKENTVKDEKVEEVEEVEKVEKVEEVDEVEMKEDDAKTRLENELQQRRTSEIEALQCQLQSNLANQDLYRRHVAVKDALYGELNEFLKPEKLQSLAPDIQAKTRFCAKKVQDESLMLNQTLQHLGSDQTALEQKLCSLRNQDQSSSNDSVSSISSVDVKQEKADVATTQQNSTVTSSGGNGSEMTSKFAVAGYLKTASRELEKARAQLKRNTTNQAIYSKQIAMKVEQCRELEAMLESANEEGKAAAEDALRSAQDQTHWLSKSLDDIKKGQPELEAKLADAQEKYDGHVRKMAECGSETSSSDSRNGSPSMQQFAAPLILGPLKSEVSLVEQNVHQLATAMLNEQYKLFAGLLVVSVPRLHGKLGVTIGENEVDDTYICTVVKVNSDYPAAKVVYPGDCVLSVGGKSVQGCRLPAVLGAFKESTLGSKLSSQGDSVSIFIQRLLAIGPNMRSPQPYCAVRDSLVATLQQQKLFNILSHVTGQVVSDPSDVTSSSTSSSSGVSYSDSDSSSKTLTVTNDSDSLKTGTQRIVVTRTDSILGVKLTQAEDKSYVVSGVKPDSLAAELLKPNDVVVAINDKDISHFSLKGLIQHLHSLPGDVVFTVRRDSPASDSRAAVKTKRERSEDSEGSFTVAECSGCGLVGEFKRPKPLEDLKATSSKSQHNPHYVRVSTSEANRVKRCGSFSLNPRRDAGGVASGSLPSEEDSLEIDDRLAELEASESVCSGDEFDCVAECSGCGRLGEYHGSSSPVAHGDCGQYCRNPRYRRHVLGEVDDDILDLLAEEHDSTSESQGQAVPPVRLEVCGDQEPLEDDESALRASLQATRAHIDSYRAVLESAQMDEDLSSWTEAVQVLQNLYHNEQVFLLKFRLLRAKVEAEKKETI